MTSSSFRFVEWNVKPLSLAVLALILALSSPKLSSAAIQLPGSSLSPFAILLSGTSLDTRTEAQFHEVSHPSRRFSTLSLEERLQQDDKHTFIMQLEHRTKEQHHDEIEKLALKHSFKVLAYIPNHAFIVLGTHQDVANANSESRHVRWTGYMPLKAKISKEFHTLEASGSLPSSTSKKQSYHLVVVLTQDIDSLDKMVKRFATNMQDDGALERHQDLVYAPATSRRFIISATSRDQANRIAQSLQHEAEVLFVQIKPVARLLNQFSTALTLNGRLQGKKKLSEIGKQLRGQGQVIGYTDSGLDYKSCYFSEDASNALPPFQSWSKTPPESIPVADANRRKIIQYVTYGDNKDDNPQLGGHGTHVAGSGCGSAAVEGSDFDEFEGIASQAKVAFFDVAGSTGSSLELPPDLRDPMLGWSYAAGARVHGNSWGTSEDGSYDVQAFDFDDFMSTHKDFLAVVASGNGGHCADGSSINSPATSKNSLSIGASHQPLDFFLSLDLVPREFSELGPKGYGVENIAAFSSTGPTVPDGRIKPDICVPGFSILSARAGHSNPSCNSFNRNEDVMMEQGTSSAAGHATGALSIIRQHFTDGYFPTGVKTAGNEIFPSAALLKATAITGTEHLTGQRLVSDAYKLPESSRRCPSIKSRSIANTIPNIHQGFGRLQLNRAAFIQDDSEGYIAFLPGRAYANASDFYDRRIATGETHTYRYCLFQGSPQARITLVWTDPPGFPGASVLLVNDLDLKVEHGSTESWGNRGVYNGNTPDRRNNVEAVFVNSSNTERIDLVIHVHGHNVPIGPSQPYALVVAGKIGEGSCSSAALPAYYRERVDDDNSGWPRMVFYLTGIASIVVVIFCTCIACKSNKGRREEASTEKFNRQSRDLEHNRRRESAGSPASGWQAPNPSAPEEPAPWAPPSLGFVGGSNTDQVGRRKRQSDGADLRPQLRRLDVHPSPHSKLTPRASRTPKHPHPDV